MVITCDKVLLSWQTGMYLIPPASLAELSGLPIVHEQRMLLEGTFSREMENIWTRDTKGLFGKTKGERERGLVAVKLSSFVTLPLSF